MNPLSNFMPYTNYISCFNVLLCPIVITPVFPTFYSKSARRDPISSSPFAEMIATLLIWALSFTGIEIFLN